MPWNVDPLHASKPWLHKPRERENQLGGMRKKLDEALCRNVGKACNAAATDTRARTLIFVPAHVFV